MAQDFTAPLYDHFLKSKGVSTDSRTVRQGELYFALRGNNFDGNKYADQALEKGAKLAVIDNPNFEKPGTFTVDNVLAALQDLARYYRSQFKGPVIGITGSNGKTTTKELTAAVLARKFRLHVTEGNLNNHIGVPLTLLGRPRDVEVMIIEMGASAIGEIATLSSICLPTHGLITNIGYAHTATFGGIDGVLRGKSELFDFLSKNKGLPFINVSDPRLRNMAKRFKKKIEYPTHDIELCREGSYVMVNYKGKRIKTHLFGDYNFTNLAAAVALGSHFEVGDSGIVDAISSYVPDNWRSQVIEKEGCTIIMDAYNANPSSMQAALQSFAGRQGKKMLILGDMLELEDPHASHAEVGKYIRKQGFERVLLVGKYVAEIKRTNPSAGYYKDMATLVSELKQMETNGYQILVKGSRSIGLERILSIIQPSKF